MAVVLDALAPYVMKLIKDMAEEEVSMVLAMASPARSRSSGTTWAAWRPTWPTPRRGASTMLWSRDG